MSKTDQLVRYTLRQLDRLSGAFDRIMQTGDEAVVHRFRVASRRLHEPLALVAPIVGRKKVSAIQKALKRVRKRLNHTRDLDVLSLSLSKAATLMEGHDREIARLAETLGERRAVEIRQARRAMLRLRPAKLAQRIESLCESLDRDAPPRQERRIAEIGEAMWRDRAEALIDMSPHDDREVDLHSVRVALKGLRYLTELRDRINETDSQPLLDTFVAMQDRLGAWNDSIVAARLVSDMATAPGALVGDARFSAFLLAYASARAKLVAAEQRECLRLWPRVEQAVRAALHPDEPVIATAPSAGLESKPVPAPRREATPAAG